MENFNGANITPDAILAQRAQVESNQPQKQQTKFDVKNYLNARLGDGEKSKTLTIRLLPFTPTSDTPFFQVHIHTIRINKAASANGSEWKTFPCPIHSNVEGVAKKCPFCEAAELARKKRFDPTTEEKEKDALKEAEFSYRAKDAWIVRCIERGHEEDGVKFWLFNASKKGDGVYDKIYNIFTQRLKKAAEQGKTNNIFDLSNGKDLLITITKDPNGKTVYNITDDDEKTPLTNNYEQGLAWINDNKKWNEVYTFKPYEYMKIMGDGGIPKFDKSQGIYVDKAELDAKEAQEIAQALSQPQQDLSQGAKSTFENIRVETSNPFENTDDKLPF